LKTGGINKENALRQYREDVQRFLADGVLTNTEAFQLSTRATTLGLTEAEANRILEEEQDQILEEEQDQINLEPTSPSQNSSSRQHRSVQIDGEGSTSEPILSRRGVLALIGGGIAIAAIAFAVIPKPSTEPLDVTPSPSLSSTISMSPSSSPVGVLPASPIPTPSPSSPPSSSGSPDTPISNPDLTIRYYPQEDERRVKTVLISLGSKAVEVGNSDTPKAPSTNAIWFGSQVSLQDVKLVAERLRQANIPIQAIRPFRDPSSKPLVIEIGADRDLPQNQHVLTLEEIRNAVDFPR
jgi:hypothetical protein